MVGAFGPAFRFSPVCMPARNKRVRPVKVRSSSARTNARFPVRDRRLKLQSRNVAYTPSHPVFIPVTWLNTVLGLMILPITWVSTRTFFALVSHSASSESVWRSAPTVLFCWGLVAWLAAFWAGLRPRYLYVLGHELTHALFVLICGGRIYEFRVTAAGGHVVTDKNNLLISLSPYFVPFWSLVAVTVYGLLGFFVDLAMVQHFRFGNWRFSLGPDAILCFFLGYTWGLHLSFTVWMVARDQPDLQQNGTFFSLVFIYTINLALILAVFLMASPDVALGDFTDIWLAELQALVRLVRGVM
jgi:hypothetical protein